MADINSWPIIGVDESGKGDFFGPLVVGGVFMKAEDLSYFDRLGVRDSKKISDGKIIVLAMEIRKRCPHNLVVIGPEKYNQLYNKIKNLNRLLGWGHARVIENILAENSAPAAISDKFGKEHFIRDNLQQKGREIELIQIVRGESHPAVAAASILARAEFVRRMDEISKEIGMVVPKGASTLVDDAGRKLVRLMGQDILGKVAKLHFKNHQKILR